MKIGFIGIGNMASAIIKGLIASKQASPEDIYLTNTTPSKLAAFVEETGTQACQTNEELVATVDIVFVATKPAVFPELLKELSEAFSQHQPLLVSIAAGISLQQLTQYVNSDQALSIIRVMPNLNTQIGEGMAAICGNEHTTEEQMQTISTIFNAVGKAIRLPEKDFSVFSAIAGCSPAFAFLFIDSLARAAVKNGLSKSQATEIAAQAVLGSAKMILDGSHSPMDLIDQVSSPGGTTVEGVLALFDNHFVSAVVKAVDAATEKDQKMMADN
ncbi:pyrroline-5-carboxylate reductase [Pisciglobus halotolerans]|uniref:Pyrroline-5-carboxylate reductase n=1 Tax=Pisciglobus halotolerans TaxID=745365 RepID=A0A1I3CNG4_9LACT|nr:pyrroline-5-carboxylate reductase [Pisciglobus halotolerans]SFH76037.1 pyrroline-5-carboxylate reductase [Pisciglobus halotolerans]